MADNVIAKVQHYVPQFLLRPFGTGKKDQLHVFDKAIGRSFVTNANNAASESRFYDFRVEAANLTIEPVLSRMESTTTRRRATAEARAPVGAEQAGAGWPA